MFITAVCFYDGPRTKVSTIISYQNHHHHHHHYYCPCTYCPSSSMMQNENSTHCPRCSQPEHVFDSACLIEDWETPETAVWWISVK